MSAAGYSGRAWRSRFLRAPKTAIVLASREDFAPLYSLAGVRLGLKTGNDGFFFVKPIGRVPAAVRLGSAKSRSTVRVSGLKGGWEGEISAADLRPAALNPHELIGPRGRQLAVPARPETLYLYPQDRQPAAELAGYVAAGVERGVHQGNLVVQNAGPGGRWYRQARGIVESAWALPYNSAYDYGAHDNRRAGAVLNGRFVGVEPLQDVDGELLGAALASTFVAATRLLEGVSTGAEGAYDVGPPAARLMAVPDVRRFSEAGSRTVQEAFGVLTKEDLLPHAPDRRAAADPARHALDVAVLRALGASAGEAQYLTGKLYESYARWRGALEDAEAAMREHRRKMNAGGQRRGADPTALAASRVRDELAASAPLLPGAALGADELQEVDVASTFRLPDQEPLVNPGWVPTVGGGEADLGSFARARYAAMLLRIGFAPPLLIPADRGVAARVVGTFDSALGKFRREATRRAAGYVGAARAEETARAAEALWLRDCRALGMEPAGRDTAEEAAG